MTFSINASLSPTIVSIPLGETEKRSNTKSEKGSGLKVLNGKRNTRVRCDSTDTSGSKIAHAIFLNAGWNELANHTDSSVINCWRRSILNAV